MGIELDTSPQFQQFSNPEKFVSPAWLSARLGMDGLKVVESDADAYLYDIGHIPGAMRIDFTRDLNDPLIRDILDAEAFAKLMEQRGISRDDTVVIYGDRANWWAAYTAWVFEIYGHPDVRLLDGGRDAWMGEERDTSFVVPECTPSTYPVPERNDAQVRTFAADLLGGVEGIQLIDARVKELYDGSNMTERTFRHGHIPGAVNVPWGRSVFPNSLFRARKDIEAIYKDFDPKKKTVVYCQSGESSAHTWFVLKHILGFEDISLYDGSWVEWGNMVRVPVAKA
ncbi:sulfurtransferase [Corynebacterium riegelii]|uniref:sulfurtransferase n=1 Tax=Corynebacterium riegelii TaxID=156976 RepID=UPI0028893E49|nr:sulfurtransferase [Corynebacterium riegelii]